MFRRRLTALALFASPVLCLAQTDEIQVYDASIAEKGKWNLMLHNNFTPSGIRTPAFPGAVISDKAVVGVAEWAYGATDWFEAGLYLPLYSLSHGPQVNGFKLRSLLVRPHADDHKFIYGVNFEFSVNSEHWDERRITSEIRPILGWHLNPIDIIVNPIMDTSYTGGLKSLDFAPAIRVAYNFSKNWAVAAEEYSDYGAFRDFYGVSEQFHQVWCVINHTFRWFDIETGAGHGITAASDKWTVKVMISRDLN